MEIKNVVHTPVQQPEGTEVFKTLSGIFYAVKPTMKNKIAEAIEAIEKDELGEPKGRGLVSIPTHVLQLLGHDFAEITAENPVTLVLRLDPIDAKAEDMMYTAAYAIIDQVNDHWAFGRVFPISDLHAAQQALIAFADKNVTSPADFMEMPVSEKPIVTNVGKDRSHLFFWEKGKDPQKLQILGPGAFKLPIKLKIDRYTPRNLEAHLKFLQGLDVTVRQDRRIAREFINCGALEKNYQEFLKLGDKPFTHAEYMAELINIDKAMLDQFEKMDALPDDKYIAAVKDLLEADAQLTWKAQWERGDTKLEFLPWVEEYTGRPFTEIHHNFLAKEFPEQFKVVESEDPDDDVMMMEPADIAVTVLGTIFEEPVDDKVVGHPNPFAIDTLTALQRNGHRITVVTGAFDEETTEKIVQALKDAGFEADMVNAISPNDRNRGQNLTDLSLAGISADMTIDFRNVGMQLHSIVNHDKQCLFWPPVTSWLQANGYLTMEDVQVILARLGESE